MVQKYDFPVQTQIGNVAPGTLPTDVATVSQLGAGGSIYWDANNASPFGTIAVVATSGSNSITFAGNVTSSLPANQLFVLSGDNTLYTATSATFNGTNTVVAITPNLNNSVTLTTSGYLATRSQITDLKAGANISGVVVGTQVTLSATGSGTPTLVEPSWRSVNRNTTTNTLTVTDNTQDPNYVFRGVASFAGTATLNIGSTGEPTAGGGNSVIQLTQSGGVLNGVANPAPIGIAVPDGTTLSTVLASSPFLTTFFTNISLWSGAFVSPNSVTFTYNGSTPAILSGTPSLQLTFTGGWTNAPSNTSSGGLVSQTQTNQAPSWGLLGSNHLIPAVNGTPANNQVPAYDATNNRLQWQNQTGGIQSINTQTGPAVNVVAGTGIGIASAGNNITVTNTGSGGIASGNFTSFNAIVQRSIANQQQQQFAPTVFVNPNDTYGFYVDITGGGFLNETGTLLDGGSIGNTTYITTATRSGTNGLQFPVSTTYGEIECQLFTHTNLVINVSFNPAFGTPTNVGVEAYFALRGLNAGSLAPYQQNAVFPPYSFSGQDGVTFLYVVQPTLTFTSTGTGTGTVTIPASQFRAISPQYTGLGGTGGGPEYIPYLRIILRNNSGASAPATSGSVNSYSGVPSMRVVVTLPGVGGSTPTIQQVLNTGNTATNTTGNVSTIILNDSVSGSSTTVDGTKLESRLHQFDGSTSGNVQVRAAATTTSYALTLPAVQATAANQTLLNNGSGVLSWGTTGATNVLPYDTITWTNSGALYASDRTIAIQTVNGTLDPTLAFITLASNLTGFTQGAAVIGTTASGQSVSGFYQVIATIPSVQTINADRASGLVAGTAYTFQWRQGKLGTAGNYIDTMPGASGIGTSVFFNELGYSGAGVSVTADAVNIGRYLLNITPTLNNILSNDNRTGGRNLVISQVGGVPDQIRFQDQTSPTPFYVGLRAPASALTANAVFTLPSVVPSATLPLVSDSAGVLSFSNTLALTTASVANAPVNSTDVARLVDVQAASQGIRPVAPSGQTVHVLSTNLVGTYVNNTGVGTATFTTTSQLIINAVTPAVNDWVLLAGQTPSSPGNIANGSYVVTSNAAGGAVLTRTNVTPAFGNLYVVTAIGATNFGEQWENVTTGTITIGTTPLVFLLFGARNPTSALIYKQTVRLATTPAQALTAIPSTLITVDGIATVAGDRVLIKDFNTPLTNVAGGIYIAGTSTWQLASDWQQNVASTLTNAVIIVSNGSVNSGSSWIQTNTIVTVGTSPTAWQLFSATGAPTLQSVLVSGKTATASASSGLTLFSDLGTPLLFQNISGIPQLTWNTSGSPVNLAANISGDLIINPTRRLSVYTSNGSTLNLLNITESNISRNGTGDLVIAGGTGATDGVVLGQNTNTIRIAGTATAGTPSITAQGDTNTSLAIVPSGTGKVIIGNSTLSQLNIDGSATATLKLQAFGSGTNIITQISGKGSSPSASAVQLATSFPNYWSFVGATTPSTGNPTVIAQPAGLGTTQNIQIAGLGNGNVLLGGLASNCGISINGGNTTQAVVIAQSATATNCDLVLGPSSGSSSVYIGDISNTAASLNVGNGNASRLTLSVISPNASAELFLSAKGTGTGVYLSTQNTNFIGVVGNVSGGRPVLVSAGSTNTDLGLQAVGTGVIYGLSIIQAANGVSFNSGTVSAATYTAQLLAANSVLTAPTAMTAGTSAQTLRSRGTSNSPGWSDNVLYTVVRISADTALSTTAVNVALALDTNQNGLGLTVSSNTVSGLNSANYYRITLSIRMISATAGTNTWHDFASGSSVSSDPAYGTGVVAYLNQTVASDNESVSITGIASGVTALRWISYASSATTLKVTGSYAIIELLK